MLNLFQHLVDTNEIADQVRNDINKMYITTLTDHILEEERKTPNATGSFTILISLIEEATKTIASHVRKTGLVDILGKTGYKNSYNEDVAKLDEYSNNLLVKTLLESGQVFAIGSEELPDIIYAPKKHAGNYIVFFDPLDGSSNVDTNSPIGTIFSIYKKSNGVLQKGKFQIATGYVLYGPSTMFVYASEYSLNMFTFDPSVGSFLLSFPNFKMPKKGNIFSLNEGNYEKFDDFVKKYLDFVKKKEYKARYVGSMIADIHRTLIKGGIFLYPINKLRLMFEVNPISFIIEKAGGMAISGNKNSLDLMPKKVTDTAVFVAGSRENVEEYIHLSLRT